MIFVLEYYKDTYRLYLNTGWSSSLNAHNRRLLTQEADLVTTHGEMMKSKGKQTINYNDKNINSFKLHINYL